MSVTVKHERGRANITEGNVPPGYKLTEVGVIPEDWEVKSLNELGVFLKGNGISRAHAQSGTIPCVRYGEIYTHHDNFIREFYSWISEEVAQTATPLKQGDILFTGSGETKEEIGKAVAFLDNFVAYAGGDIIILRPQRIEVDSLFLGYLLNSKPVVLQKASKGQGDAVVHITAKILANIKIPLPPLPEQRAIAGALSDVDQLLASLDKLIAKKKAIKQAAMQQLLTGKARLPGFSGEWEVKRLGDVAIILKGELITSSMAKGGNIPVIAGGITISYFHDKPNRVGKNITISASGANAGFVSFHKKPIFASDCSTISEAPNYNIEFLYYVLKLDQQKIFNLQTGGAQPHVYPDQLRDLEILIPTDINEQTEVAKVLSDMDAEIQALERRREKIKQIKQGMMQQLLTGRVRLV
jgi:type I restriction enzyme S subunit